MLNLKGLRYLLLQVRKSDDPMRSQEIDCFARVLHCDTDQIRTLDLRNELPSRRTLDDFDVVLLGGSGHYGATDDEPWLLRALDCMREIHHIAKPTFASCWGFQAMSRAMGGEVIKDLRRAELGTHQLFLTDAGRDDPVFMCLGSRFEAQVGHEDCVVRLPEDAIRLASTQLVENQAFRFEDKPIWCTQFHPELDRAALLQRVRTYPEYVERIAGMPFEQFAEVCHDTPETEALLLCFVRIVFGD